MTSVAIVVSLLVAGVGGIWLVPAVLALAPAPTAGTRARERAAALLRGGLLIGVLERLAVTASVLVGHPEGVAIVVAIKGLGRYPELRNAASTDPDSTAENVGAAVSERFIIGTLASLLWALACGLGGLWWLAALAR